MKLSELKALASKPWTTKTAGIGRDDLRDLIAAVEALQEIDNTLSGSMPITAQCKAIARAALKPFEE